MDNTPVDPDVIDPIVNDMMLGHGIKWFPDFVERALYKNVITCTLRLLDSIFKRMTIKLFGHEIVFDVKKKSD